MKRHTEEDIVRMLEGGERPEPPPSLAARIQEEIPETLVPTSRPFAGHGALWLAAAASLVAALGGLSAWWWYRTPEPVSHVVHRTPTVPVAELKDVKEAEEPDEPVKEPLEEVEEQDPEAPAQTTPVASLPEPPVAPMAEQDELNAPIEEPEITLYAKEKTPAEPSTRKRSLVAPSRVHLPSAPPPPPPAMEPPPTRMYRTADEIVRGVPSTGGTTEPNDAIYDRVYFQHYGVHPFVDTEDDPLSTFALDVDTGSYTVARRFLEDGHLPEPDAVRVEEFVNYFDYEDPAPVSGDFAIRLEGAPTPFTGTARTKLLRIGIRARDVVDENRRPAVLTFLVDVSGSMAREDRLGLVKKGLSLLAGDLRADDRVGLVVFGTNARAVLEPTNDVGSLERAMDLLSPEGSTNLAEGLALAYQMAGRHLDREDAIHRIVLCSDGVANVGSTGWESILDETARWRKRGVELSAIGFGMGNYNDVLMEQLANHADGSYAYVDDLDEARRVFVEGLTGMLQTIARDAKIQVAFEPSVVESYRLLGYENRRLEHEDFRDDTKDAGEIGAGHRVTALYEVKLREDLPEEGNVAEVRLRYHAVDAGKTRELAEKIALSDLAPSWETSSPSLRLAAVVAEMAEVLRGSYWAREGSLEQVLAEARKLLPELSTNEDVVELVHLLGQAEKRKGNPQ